MPDAWDSQRAALPGLEVPLALASLLEPGAPLGPPPPPADDEDGAAAQQELDGEARPQKRPQQEEEGPATSGGLQELMNVFLASMKEGVGLSMLFDCLGILVLEVRLLAAPTESLQLIFNGVRRCIPLCDVQEVRVQRAYQGGASGSGGGAWLVDLELVKEGACTFVFNGNEEGQRESHYFGGCLRTLVHGVRMRASEGAYLRPGSSGQRARRELGGMQAPIMMQVNSKLTGDASSTGVENLEAEIAAELAKYD